MLVVYSVCYAILTWSSQIKAQTVGRRYFHASVLADNWIYIDGGEITKFDSFGNISDLAPVNDTLAINLSENWTNATVQLVRTQRSATAPPAINFQSLWWDKKLGTIYSFGGEKSGLSQRASVPTTEESIWGLNIDGAGSGKWAEYVGSTAETTWTQGLVRPTNGFSVSDGKIGYYFSGLGSNFTDPNLPPTFQLIPGFLTFDFDNHVLSNSTNIPNAASMWVSPGRMVSVPVFGTQGVLLALGGGPGEGEAGAGIFNNITFYDVESQKWLSQSAKGDIPSPRNKFCAFGVQGGDNSSFEIWVYGGGYSPGIPDNDFHILSLPAFQWFRAQNPSPDARVRHTCHPAGNSQMIIIGGYATTPDPWAQQINVYDMSALQWKDSYEANADPYTPPGIVTQYYKNSNSPYPSTWTSPEVQSIFENSTNMTSNSTSPSSPSTPSSTKLSSGAVAGIVIGALAGVLAMAIGCFLLVRKRRRVTREIARPAPGDEHVDLKPMWKPDLNSVHDPHELPPDAGRVHQRHELPSEGVRREQELHGDAVGGEGLDGPSSQYLHELDGGRR